MFWTIVYAAEGTTQPTSASPLVTLFPFIMIFVVFWFLLIRPQQKRQREHQGMLSNLKKGDKVITNGGVYGAVIGVSERVVVLRVADNVKLEIAKNCIASLQPTKAEE